MPGLAAPRPGEVHAWAISVAAAEARGAFRHLAPDEHERAARFVVPEPRRRYAAGRGLLRHLLGLYLDRPPERVAIGSGRNGKPVLAGGGLHFSVSHSRDRLLLGFAGDRPLGVDVEEVRDTPDLLAVARRYFAPDEAAGLAALRAPERAASFFSLWTRKEACLKVHGEGVGAGLARPLPEFAPVVALEMDLGPGYRAAIAAPGSDWTPRRFDSVPD